MKLNEQYIMGQIFNDPSYKNSCGTDSNVGYYGFVENEERVNQILDYIRNNVWPSLKLWQYFVVNVDFMVEKFRERLLNPKHPLRITTSQDEVSGILSQPLVSIISIVIKLIGF